MRLSALLIALLALAAPAAAADVPGSATPSYAIVRAHFTPKEILADPGGPDPYIGVKVKGEVAVSRLLTGKLAHRRFGAALWLPQKSGPLDLYLLLATEWEGGAEIAGWSPVRDGFCIQPEQALDGPMKQIARLGKQHPCKRR